MIVDTIGRLFDVDDFNDYSKVTKATQILLDLRSEFGTTFCMLHHNNNADGVLGSVQWQAMVDTIMAITRAPESKDRFVRTTQRSGTDMEPSRLTYDLDTGAITITEPKFAADQRAAEQRILQYVSLLGRPATREDLAGHSGRGRAVGRAAVDALVTAGLLRPQHEGKARLYVPVSGFGRRPETPDESADELLDYAEIESKSKMKSNLAHLRVSSPGSRIFAYLRTSSHNLAHPRPANVAHLRVSSRIFAIYMSRRICELESV